MSDSDSEEQQYPFDEFTRTKVRIDSDQGVNKVVNESTKYTNQPNENNENENIEINKVNQEITQPNKISSAIIITVVSSLIIVSYCVVVLGLMLIKYLLFPSWIPFIGSISGNWIFVLVISIINYAIAIFFIVSCNYSVTSKPSWISIVVYVLVFANIISNALYTYFISFNPNNTWLAMLIYGAIASIAFFVSNTVGLIVVFLKSKNSIFYKSVRGWRNSTQFAMVLIFVISIYGIVTSPYYGDVLYTYLLSIASLLGVFALLIFQAILSSHDDNVFYGYGTVAQEQSSTNRVMKIILNSMYLFLLTVNIIYALSALSIVFNIAPVIVWVYNNNIASVSGFPKITLSKKFSKKNVGSNEYRALNYDEEEIMDEEMV